ncbi:MAG: family 16 glycosylhydrolase [Spirochaetales bacterium]|nr:family 16 glycosylhydrolase [Spirochaetales bacterium]
MRFWRSSGLTILVLIFLAWTSACSSPTDSSSSSTTVTLTSISASPATVSLAVGSSEAELATAHYSDGSSNALVYAQWSSNTPSVATVSAGGVITAVGGGSAAVTVTSGTLSATVSVTVPSGTSLTGLTVNPTSVNLAPGATQSVAVTAHYSNGSTAALTNGQWTTSASSIATVSSSGVITAVAGGTATVTVTYGGYSAAVSVTVPTAEPASNGDPWYGGTLLWSSEFNGSSINTAKWAFDTGGGGWGNSELETYTTTNASIQNVQDGSYLDSCLVITASEDSIGNWTSARLKTEGLKNFTYGKIEARIKLPYGPGMWPAFWMLGSNIGTVGWPQCGETDIMEMIGSTNTTSSTLVPSNSTVYGTIHLWNSSTSSNASYQPEQYTLPSGIFASAFHTFGVVWTSTSITFYVDGVAQGSVTPDSTTGTTFQQSFFILLNLAVGGTWPGNPTSATVSPQTMDVDWVRVYQ